MNLARRLKSTVDVRIQPLPDGVDPDDLTDEALSTIARTLLVVRFTPVDGTSLHIRCDSTPTGE